jgi:Fe-S cluster assembly iron-binding protein IscA
MLQLSRQAAVALQDARHQERIPEHFGLRVSGSSNDSRSGIHLTFVEEPAQGDEVSEREGVKLFVAPDLAEPLANLVIDVNMDAPASELGLTLRSQGGEAPDG